MTFIKANAFLPTLNKICHAAHIKLLILDSKLLLAFGFNLLIRVELFTTKIFLIWTRERLRNTVKSRRYNCSLCGTAATNARIVLVE